MGKEQKQEFVTHITPRSEDFSQWYTDVIKQTELCDYAPVRGCMIIRPYGYAIWERIQAEMDARFKETGAENVYFPMLIPWKVLRLKLPGLPREAEKSCRSAWLSGRPAKRFSVPCIPSGYRPGGTCP